MITCSEARPLLALFLEKETGPLETLETRRHLDGCRACSARAERMSGLLRTLDDLPCPEVPRDMGAAVMSSLRVMKAGLSKRDGAALAAKWSGLVLLLASGLSGAAASARVLAARADGVLGGAGTLAGDGAAADGVRELIGGAVPVALRALKGGAGWGVLAKADTGLSVAVQVLATGLCFALLLAIPVALTTAWLLHKGSAPGAARTR